jgi:hypothetical protein
MEGGKISGKVPFFSFLFWMPIVFFCFRFHPRRSEGSIFHICFSAFVSLFLPGCVILMPAPSILQVGLSCLCLDWWCQTFSGAHPPCFPTFPRCGSSFLFWPLSCSFWCPLLLTSVQSEAVPVAEVAPQSEDPLQGKFTWKINGFSKLTTRKMYSETFVVGSYKWWEHITSTP